MKRLIIGILSVMLLFGCSSRGRYAAMRQELDSINALNRAAQPYTSAEAQKYIDYFKHHGTPNDQLLAHYLLGRAYQEEGDMPMALQCYHQAIECADTTSNDCDYSQLCRVYGQMSIIFYSQYLYQEQMKCLNAAKKYAWMAHDTLPALLYQEHRSVVFRYIGLIDSAIAASETVANEFSKYGYHHDAAIALGGIIRILTEKGDYAKARRYMENYESTSNRFDSLGNIQKGREIYYYMKGLLYLKENKIDSAEYWFRKELNDGKDFNNQNAAATGLSMVYEQRHCPDSTAKYARFAYAMNDSINAKKTSEIIERIQATYNYSRYQELALKESAKASHRAIVIWICIGIAILIIIVSYIIYKDIRRKRREFEQKYLHSLSIIEQARHDLAKLQANKEANAELIAEKEQAIKEQSLILQNMGTNIPLYKKFVIKGRELTEEEWIEIRDNLFRLSPTFQTFMKTHSSELNDKEYKTCVLIRAGFKPKAISNMLGTGPSYISNIRTKLLMVLFHQEGTPKQFDELLLAIK